MPSTPSARPPRYGPTSRHCMPFNIEASSAGFVSAGAGFVAGLVAAVSVRAEVKRSRKSALFFMGAHLSGLATSTAAIMIPYLPREIDALPQTDASGGRARTGARGGDPRGADAGRRRERRRHHRHSRLDVPDTDLRHWICHAH